MTRQGTLNPGTRELGRQGTGKHVFCSASSSVVESKIQTRHGWILLSLCSSVGERDWYFECIWKALSVSNIHTTINSNNKITGLECAAGQIGFKAALF